MELDAQIIRRDGKEEFAVIPWKQFLELQERLDDAEDLLDLRKARSEDDDARISHKDAKRKLGI